MTQKVASFEWDLEQKKALQQVQVAVQAALPLGRYDPADLVVLELSVADRMLFVAFGRPLWVNHRGDFGIWELYYHLNTVISP